MVTLFCQESKEQISILFLWHRIRTRTALESHTIKDQDELNPAERFSQGLFCQDRNEHVFIL